MAWRAMQLVRRAKGEKPNVKNATAPMSSLTLLWLRGNLSPSGRLNHGTQTALTLGLHPLQPAR